MNELFNVLTMDGAQFQLNFFTVFIHHGEKRQIFFFTLAKLTQHFITSLSGLFILLDTCEKLHTTFSDHFPIKRETCRVGEKPSVGRVVWKSQCQTASKSNAENDTFAKSIL